MQLVMKGSIRLVWPALLLAAIPAHAQDCPAALRAEARDASGVVYEFWPVRLANEVQDLVMASPSAPDQIRRVTYGGSREAGCHFQALAMARGGDWGWHLAWSNARGVFYARMDGAAWVSSPPKRFSRNSARQIEFSLDGPLQLRWQEEGAAETRSVSSEDEGRNWSEPVALPGN